MKDKIMDDDVENVGIMQGFLDQVGEEEDELEEEEGSEESSAARVLNRRPDSPEILMNNLRGDMRSVDARREELADLVGYDAAAETPDSVLAMLQPVLAQQGGIGALPQSGPMAQGPQAPMPPPSGGAMGGPPPGAPPLPPGGPPPPAGGDMAALLAAAGPPPGGGMAPGGPPPGAGPGPMMGPDGQPIPPEGMPPLQMYRGGEVKRFSDGSPDPDEDDDATQKEDFGSDSFYTPEMVASARQNLINLIGQRAAPEVNVRKRALEREKLYEELLGDDKKMQQAQLLFALAQKGLQFAGNVDARGQPLRGSPASRFAAVAAELPSDINRFIADSEKRRTAIRTAAIQAAEKEAEDVRAGNIRLVESQRRAYGDVLRNASRSANTSMFGKGGMGPFYNTVLTPGAAQAYADGALTPEEDNAFQFAVNKIVADARPRTEIYKDELGRDVTRPIPGYEIPPFLVSAIAQRKQLDALGPRPAVAPTRGTVPLGADAAIEIDRASGETPATVQAADMAKRAETQTTSPKQPTLWEMAPSLSFIEVAKGNIARNVPLAGNIAAQAQQNQNYYNNQVRELIRIMQNSPRFAEGERESIERELNMGLQMRRDANALRNIFMGVDRFLAEKLDQAKIDYANEELVPEIRKAAQDDIRSITAFREKLMPPRVYSLDEVKALPVGSPFFYKNETNYRVRQ